MILVFPDFSVANLSSHLCSIRLRCPPQWVNSSSCPFPGVLTHEVSSTVCALGKCLRSYICNATRVCVYMKHVRFTHRQTHNTNNTEENRHTTQTQTHKQHTQQRETERQRQRQTDTNTDIDTHQHTHNRDTHTIHTHTHTHTYSLSLTHSDTQTHSLALSTYMLSCRGMQLKSTIAYVCECAHCHLLNEGLLRHYFHCFFIHICSKQNLALG